MINDQLIFLFIFAVGLTHRLDGIYDFCFFFGDDVWKSDPEAVKDIIARGLIKNIIFCACTKEMVTWGASRLKIDATKADHRFRGYGC